MKYELGPDVNLFGEDLVDPQTQSSRHTAAEAWPCARYQWPSTAASGHLPLSPRRPCRAAAAQSPRGLLSGPRQRRLAVLRILCPDGGALVFDK